MLRLVTVSMLVSISGFCQDIAIKPFGEVSMAEMMMNQCPFDSGAIAMIVFDKGEFEIEVTQGSKFKRHTRIKILNKDAASAWASKTVYYGKGIHSFSKFKASTYNLVDGKILETKVDEENLFKGRYDKYNNQVRFSWPQVNDGSIIEFTYTLSTNGIHGPPSWQFQDKIPTMVSEYTMVIPSKYFGFRKDWQGNFIPKREQIGDREKITVVNVPAFIEEPLISSEENYICKLNLFIEKIWIPGWAEQKLINSWSTVAGQLNQSEFGLQVEGSGFLKPKVAELVGNVIDPEQKIQILYDYVKKTITWNGQTDIIPDRQFKEVLESNSGSSSEINGILISLLKKAGVAAEPVLIKTRDQGFLKPDLPIISQFNDLICRVKVGEKVSLIDATVYEMPMNVLPKRCINGAGLVVGKDVYEWMDISTSRSRVSIATELNLLENGTASGTITIAHEGHYASSMRKSFKEKGEDGYVRSFLTGKNWERSKSSFENISDYKVAARETHEVSIPGFGTVAGNFMYLNPIAHGRMESNPLKSEKREYPVDYGAPFDEVYFGKIKIPDGYVIEALPQSIVLAMPERGGKFTYNLSVEGNIITVVNQLVIVKSTFDTEKYPFLREFYTQIVAKQSEQIVLRKK